MFSPLRILYNFRIGEFLLTLKSLRVHLALLKVDVNLTGNNTILCEEKRNMNVRLGIPLEVFKGGLKIMHMKA